MAQRAPWGHTKIQALALSDEIAFKVKQGIPTRQIYNELRESGRIDMAERSFYRWVKELRSSNPARSNADRKAPAKRLAPAPSPASSSPIASAEMRTLQYSQVDHDTWDGASVPELDITKPSPGEQEGDT